MAPSQCPECGRFLAEAFVAGLADEAAPCPRCEILLTHDRIVAGTADTPDDQPQSPPSPDPETDTPADEVDEPEPAPPAIAEVEDAVPPVAKEESGVADEQEEARPAPDPLAGWDEDDLDDAAFGYTTAPPAGAVIAGAGVAGALLGSLVADRRGRGLLLGLLAGILAAVGALQIWRRPD